MLVQRSFDDLGTPLHEVTFCVVDLETTGGSPATCGITEVGAVKVRRGEVMGTFQSLVKPLEPVPAFIRLLTGISDELLVDAPPIEAVLPAFLEFARNTVLVAHNARFDVSFLNKACEAHGYPLLEQRVVDTAGLARKVLAGEVRDRRLETLVRHLRCAHRPCHRAYSDALATVDVLHGLIERLSGFGVTTLEDLVSASFTRLDGTFAKITLAEGLPDAPGLYRFLGASGQTLYVGKATNLRTRVRSYFYGDPRRRMRDLLRETQQVVFDRHETMLEAEVAEARAISAHRPPYNRAGKRPTGWFVKLSGGKARGKIATARAARRDGAYYLGPFTAKEARAVVEAIRDASALHRCSMPERCRGCAFSELGVCSGQRIADHRRELHSVVTSLASDPRPLLDALAARMHRLAAQQRFEEAAEVRERGALLERALLRDAQVRALQGGGSIRVAIAAREVVLDRGRLVGPSPHGDRRYGEWPSRETCMPPDESAAREARLISSWLLRNATDVELVSVDGVWASPAHFGPSGRFKPRRVEQDVAAPGPRTRA